MNCAVSGAGSRNKSASRRCGATRVPSVTSSQCTGAPGDKGEFMTAEMEAFFGSLVDDAGAVIDVLVDGAGHSIGAAFGFEDDDTYYLYNSAFDPECAALSPGIVLVTSLIDSVITSGRKRVDFLKGWGGLQVAARGSCPAAVCSRGGDVINRVAFLSIHSSPLALPGTGDAGGMNVYIDSLARTLAGRDIEVDVFTRRVDPDTPDETEVAPGYCVIQVDADGEDRADLVGSFAEGVAKWIVGRDAIPDILHSHYWLSGWAGVLLQDALSIPLAISFHTLGRVKGGHPVSG